MTTTTCPDRKTLAAFSDGRLDSAARRSVMEHMTACSRCDDLLMTGGFRRATRSFPLAAAAAVLALAVVMLSIEIYRMAPRKQVAAKSDMELIIAASMPLRYRPSLARLSADFPYRNVAPPGHARVTFEDRTYAQLFDVTAQLQKEASATPLPPQLHALGVSYLLAGNVPSAVETLQRALRSETKQRGEIIEAIRRSQNYALLNDLAAAYQALTERNGDLTVRPLALEAVERAWAHLRTPQIAWTRAVVIDSFHIHEQSVAAWRDYLALESHSQWSDFARLRLNDALQPTARELWPSVRTRLLASRDDGAALRDVDGFRQDVRFLCEDELLPQWAEAVLRGDPAAPEHLSKIAMLGRALERAGGGRDVAGAVEAIRKASAPALRQLAKGHAAYGAGRRADRNNDAAGAMRAMNDAVAALTPELTPFAWRARIERAGELYSLNDYGRALDELQQILERAPQLSNDCNGYAHLLIGSTYLQLSSYKESADHYARALEAFRRAGEREYEATLVSRLGTVLQLAGDEPRARPYRDEGLKLLDRTGDLRHRHEAMIDAALVAIDNDHQAVAELFLDTLVANDRAAHNYVTTCSSLMWRSSCRFRRGSLESAAGDLDDAQRVCRSIPDPAMRERMLANIELARASVGSNASSAGLDEAIGYYQRTNSHVWLRTAYFARARLASERGDAVAAERDFRAALGETEAIRGKIDEREIRMSFTATADEVTDGYVEFLLRQHRAHDAFEAADRGRLRELVDSPTARWSAPAAGALLPRIQASLPFGAALIEYRVLRKNIVAWVISADAFNTIELPVSIGDVKSSLAALETGGQELALKANASYLYDVLLRRAEPVLKNASVLVIVPDDDLERIPYSALYDGLHGRYVLETRATVVAPSATLFEQSVARLRERSRNDGRMLVVKAASGGAAVSALPEAAAEARSIARLYPNTQVVDGSVEAASVLLNRAKNASFLQFVGHTTVDAGAMRALRFGDSKDAQLGVADILAAALPKLRLVYLSACETDSGPILKSEGSITIARTFFAAGVPVVVGTVWPVDDGAARLVARAFHEHLRQGDSPAESLRKAQLSLMSHDPLSRIDWAAFRVIGAGV